MVICKRRITSFQFHKSRMQTVKAFHYFTLIKLLFFFYQNNRHRRPSNTNVVALAIVFL